MFYALSWFLLFGLLAIGSLAVWALRSFTAWSASNVGALEPVAASRVLAAHVRS